MRTVILENELVRMVLLPDKGTDVMELEYKPKGVDVLWHSPTGYRALEGYRGSIETTDSQFMDYYGGGWQDLLPVTGSGPIELHGAKFGQHGETSLLRWDVRIEESEGDSAVVELKTKGVRYPYSVSKRITLKAGEAKFDIEERLWNSSSQELEFFWTQHPAYGEPFLAPGCKLELPIGSVVHNVAEINPNGRVAGGEFDWPTVGGKDGGTIDLSAIPDKGVVAEETTFIRVKVGRYTLHNPRLDLGVTMKWDESVFPWVWFWQNYSWPDSPYFGEAWNVAVEPSSSLPTTMEMESGMRDAIRLKGKASIETKIEVGLHEMKD